MNAKFANLALFSDVKPYEIVRVVSDKTIEIREMKVERDVSWKPDFAVGGFVAHCKNQNEQKHIIKVDEENPVIRARLRKDGKFHSAYGKHVLTDEPRYFYDYNF